MKKTSIKTAHALKTLGLILTIGALPVFLTVTGCKTGTRYTQSSGEKMDDNGLTSHVKTALKEDFMYKYEEVNVVTFKGVVQLSGFVAVMEQKGRAGEIASKIKGVADVQNNITVKQ